MRRDAELCVLEALMQSRISSPSSPSLKLLEGSEDEGGGGDDDDEEGEEGGDLRGTLIMDS